MRRSARRLVALAAAAGLWACSGPAAPDAALCQDVISRLCLARTCPGLTTQLALGTQDCQPTLEQRTGCGEDSFAFSGPSRERVLHCRLPLVRQSTDPGRAPACEDVSQLVQECPDVISFLREQAP